MHIFSKVYKDAMDQLEKGKEWLKHIMKMLNMKSWKSVCFVAFPNIDNREALIEAGLFITAEELKVCSNDLCLVKGFNQVQDVSVSIHWCSFRGSGDRIIYCSNVFLST